MAKDLLENKITRKKFEKLVIKLYFEIEEDLIDTLFDEKYRKLEELSLKVNLDKLNDEVIKKYKRIKEFNKEHDEPAILI